MLLSAGIRHSRPENNRKMNLVTLILLPGMDGTGDLFEPFTRALRGEFKVVVVSFPQNGPQTYRHLEAVAYEAMPPDGPLVLVGESFSGPLAIAIAAANPTRVVGLVLCCTFLRNPRPLVRLFGALASSIPSPLPPLGVLSHFLLGRFQSASLREALKNALRGIPSATLRARLRSVLTVDVSADAKQIKVPVLYLQASADRVVPKNALQVIAKYCDTLEWELIDGPHCLLQAAPDPAAKAVSQFVSRLPQLE